MVVDARGCDVQVTAPVRYGQTVGRFEDTTFDSARAATDTLPRIEEVTSTWAPFRPAVLQLAITKATVSVAIGMSAQGVPAKIASQVEGGRRSKDAIDSAPSVAAWSGLPKGDPNGEPNGLPKGEPNGLPNGEPKGEPNGLP